MFVNDGTVTFVGLPWSHLRREPDSCRVLDAKFCDKGAVDLRKPTWCERML